LVIREQLRLRNLKHKVVLGLDEDDDEDSDEIAGAGGLRDKETTEIKSSRNKQRENRELLRRGSDNRQS